MIKCEQKRSELERTRTVLSADPDAKEQIDYIDDLLRDADAGLLQLSPE